MRLRLVQPTKRYASSYIAALKERLPSSSNPESLGDQISHLSEHMRWWRKIAARRKRSERVHTYWLVDGTRYLGLCQIRQTASGRHARIKSNVYYELRPSQRGKGLGEILFKLALRKARALGIRTIIVSCSAANTPSRAIIETAGGQWMRTVHLKGEPATLLYRFVLSTASRRRVRR